MDLCCISVLFHSFFILFHIVAKQYGKDKFYTKKADKRLSENRVFAAGDPLARKYAILGRYCYLSGL